MGDEISVSVERDKVGPALDRLVRQGVDDALELIAPLIESDRIFRHSSYPVLGHYESGQPKIDRERGPADYAGAFRHEADEYHVSLAESDAVRALGDLFLADDNLRGHALLPGTEGLVEFHEKQAQSHASSVVSETLGRLLSTVGPAFSEGDFDAVWKPIRRGLLEDTLPIQIVVPLCLASVDCIEPFEFGTAVRIERLSEGEQLARAPSYLGAAAAHPCVVHAATHALVLDRFHLTGKHLKSGVDWSRPSFYPTEVIEGALQALRIATTAPVGYAQIYMRPLGWTLRYKADLPPVIEGALVRSHPPEFDDFGWLRPPARIQLGELQHAATIFQALSEGPSSLRLAARRFSNAQLRHDEEDSILDLCIALEAALGDNDKGEMTYKLGMRAGVLARQHLGALRPTETRRRVSSLYGWRSAIVHGKDVKKERGRFARSSDADEDALNLATNLVRSILSTVIPRPELHKTRSLDSLLLDLETASDDRT